MNRFEYMRRLEALLSDISPSEKEEALTYYNDYFNDAGQENEQQVIEELGSPEQVAAGVKEGLGLQTYEREQDSLEGEKSQNQSAPGERDRDAGVQNTRSQNAFSQNNQIPSRPQQKQSKPAWLITLIVIGLILASPLILALICVVFAAPMVGNFDTELVREFFYAVSYTAGMNLHIRMLDGANAHHIIEAMFKSFAKALDEATKKDERITDVLSTKGSL